MCGIAGIFERTGKKVDSKALFNMQQSLRHRGSDDAGIWTEGGIGLAHCRLAIRDLSPLGRQPQADPSGRFVVSYNGEIYNDKELRLELQHDFGFVFRSTCDTEVIPLGYMAWGDDLFSRLEGMFAIALWDRETHKLILARDAVGIKPFFYFANENIVRFGSEIKAILADPSQQRELCPLGVHKFLALGYVGPTTTTMKDIKQVQPGSLIAFTKNTVEKKIFWAPQRSRDIYSLNTAVEAFFAIWPDVINDHMASDMPIAILQSSGIDSTLISLAASRSLAAPPSLFTAKFHQKSFDEIILAKRISQIIGASFHPVSIESESINLSEILRKVIIAFDGQIADEASIPLYLLSAAVSQHYKVALTGDGGDEFFAGYSTYIASRNARWLAPIISQKIWQKLGQRAYHYAPLNEQRLPTIQKLRRFMLGIAEGGAMGAHAYWRRMLPSFLLPKLYGPNLSAFVDIDPMSEYGNLLQNGFGNLTDRALIADQQFYLPANLLLKSDAMSMAHGLELRVPLLDKRIIELANRIDSNVLMGWNGVGKRVLRNVAKKFGAPDAIVRASKKGFNTPLSWLLRNNLLQLSEICFDKESERLYPWLRPDAVRTIWKEHRDGLVNHDYALWPILNLSLWLAEMQRVNTNSDNNSVSIIEINRNFEQ